MERVLLLLPTTTYKAQDFLAAADRLGIEVVVGTDRSQALEREAPAGTVVLALDDAERAEARLRKRFPEGFAAVVGVDDETVVLAAKLSGRLGLPHNPVESVVTTRNKGKLRRALAAAKLRTPAFLELGPGQDPRGVADELGFPLVVKPLGMAAGRGVLRADDLPALVAAVPRVRALLERPEPLIVERYLDGTEVAVEGLLHEGELTPLAIFDKPDPLVGPTFEETIYVTPSRAPERTRRAIVEQLQRGCDALGLRHGPVHAELRIDETGPWIVEIAARTIGGLCSRTLRFGAGWSLEELVLRQALGRPSAARREDRAAGVMMIPIPRAGVLRAAHGLDEARAIEGIEELTLTLRPGAALVPLPEGNRYLGFIFATGDRPDEVERALRAAHARLRFEIDVAQ